MEREKTLGGETWQLQRETRWTRIYRSDQNDQKFYDESKFRDGSAAISLQQLSAEWPTWNSSEQLDFCNAFSHSSGLETADICRFLAKNGCQHVVSAIALSIAHSLPPEEAASILLERCKTAPLGKGANFFQALAQTTYPDRFTVLRDRLNELVKHADCWEKGAEYFNDFANEVVYTIDNLLNCGEPMQDFMAIYLRLKEHPHEFTRRVTKNLLAKRFEPQD